MTSTKLPLVLLIGLGFSCSSPTVPPDSAPVKTQDELAEVLSDAEPKTSDPEVPTPSSKLVDLGFTDPENGDGQVTVELLDQDRIVTAEREGETETQDDWSCKSNKDCSAFPTKKSRVAVCRRNQCIDTTPRDAKRNYRCRRARECETRGLNRPKMLGQWACEARWCVFEVDSDLGW